MYIRFSNSLTFSDIVSRNTAIVSSVVWVTITLTVGANTMFTALVRANHSCMNATMIVSSFEEKEQVNTINSNHADI